MIVGRALLGIGKEEDLHIEKFRVRKLASSNKNLQSLIEKMYLAGTTSHDKEK